MLPQDALFRDLATYILSKCEIIFHYLFSFCLASTFTFARMISIITMELQAA